MRYEKGSFITVPNKTQLKSLSLGARAVFVEFCDMADSSGCCFPSRSTLADRIGMSTDSVDRFIEELLKCGFITKTRRKGENNSYTSNLYQIMILDEEVAAPMPLPSRTDTATPSRTHAELTVSIVTKPTEDSEDGETGTRSLRVIPLPYSVESTREAWANGEPRLQILRCYLDSAGLWNRASTKGKLQAIMNRHNNAAVRIAKAGWSPSELLKAIAKVKSNDSLYGEWTLETVEKYLTK